MYFSKLKIILISKKIFVLRLSKMAVNQTEGSQASIIKFMVADLQKIMLCA